MEAVYSWCSGASPKTALLLDASQKLVSASLSAPKILYLEFLEYGK